MHSLSGKSKVHEVRSFLGICLYYRPFIKSFAEIARPLHKLTDKSREFIWNDECQASFDKLKQMLILSPILSYPDMTKQFVLDCDASGVGIGSVLSQIHSDGEHVVACYSKS